MDRADDTFHSDGALRRRALERHGCEVVSVDLVGGSVLERLRRLSLAERVAKSAPGRHPGPGAGCPARGAGAGRGQGPPGRGEGALGALDLG